MLLKLKGSHSNCPTLDALWCQDMALLKRLLKLKFKAYVLKDALAIECLEVLQADMKLGFMPCLETLDTIEFLVAEMARLSQQEP